MRGNPIKHPLNLLPRTIKHQLIATLSKLVHHSCHRRPTPSSPASRTCDKNFAKLSQFKASTRRTRDKKTRFHEQRNNQQKYETLFLPPNHKKGTLGLHLFPFRSEEHTSELQSH